MNTTVINNLGTLVLEHDKNKIDLLCTRIIEHYEDRKNFRSDNVDIQFKENGTFSVWHREKPILFYKNNTCYKELENQYYSAVLELHDDMLYFYDGDNLVRMCTRDFEDKDFIFNIGVTYSTEVICSLYMSMKFITVHNWNLVLDREYMTAFLRDKL